MVGTGEDVLIAGFILAGASQRKVIVRALGPTLGTLGVSGALADPTIAIVNSSNVVVASNDNWKDTQQAQIAASGFAPPNDLESGHYCHASSRFLQRGGERQKWRDRHRIGGCV
jgi:hypothetical protein